MAETVKQLKARLAMYEQSYKEADNASDKADIQLGMDALRDKISRALIKMESEAEGKGKKKAPVKKSKKGRSKKSKASKKKKATAKAPAKPKEVAKPKPAPAKKKKEEPDCEELAKAWEKRQKIAKKAGGKKTTPILKRAAAQMETIVRSGIKYNEGKGGDINVKLLKAAVDAMGKALDKFKDALKGELEDTFIDKFKADMNKIIAAAEKKSKK